MKGDLPPSSSESFLGVFAVALRMMRPTSVEPVKAILSMSGCSTMRGAGAAVAGDDVEHAGGQADLGGDLGEGEGGERGELGGLDDDGVAGGERGRDLPGEHQQREVPGDDLADDADGRVAAELFASKPFVRSPRSCAQPAWW